MENQGVSCVQPHLCNGRLEDLETLVEKSYGSSRLPEEAATGEGGSFDKCPLLEIKNSAVSPAFVRKDIKDIKAARARAQRSNEAFWRKEIKEIKAPCA